MVNRINMLNTIGEVLEFDSNLVHAAIISSLIEKTDSSAKLAALSDISTRYLEYLNANLALTGYSEEVIKARVALLNGYYDYFYDNGNFLKHFSAQTKLRSTILEEFMYLLFRDYVEEKRTATGDANGILRHGSATAYTNLYFYAKDFGSFITNVCTGLNEKDQDYAIYRTLDMTVDGNPLEKPLNIPVIVVECKTYLDRTMLEGAIATASEIKTGSPYSNFYVVAEQYNVDKNVDPSYSRIKQIYVLRKEARKKGKAPQPVFDDVVLRMFGDMVGQIERPWSNVHEKMTRDGVIM